MRALVGRAVNRAAKWVLGLAGRLDRPTSYALHVRALDWIGGRLSELAVLLLDEHLANEQ